MNKYIEIFKTIKELIPLKEEYYKKDDIRYWVDCSGPLREYQENHINIFMKLKGYKKGCKQIEKQTDLKLLKIWNKEPNIGNDNEIGPKDSIVTNWIMPIQTESPTMQWFLKEKESNRIGLKQMIATHYAKQGWDAPTLLHDNKNIEWFANYTEQEREIIKKQVDQYRFRRMEAYVNGITDNQEIFTMSYIAMGGE